MQNNSETSQKELVPLVQQMIRNACVNTGSPDSGNEIKNAETLQKLLTESGIKSELLSCRENRSNLIARLPGKNSEAPSLAFMGHLDVVPASAKNWKYPPFKAEIVDNKLYGRGAVDMLNMTASMALAFAQLGREKYQPEGDLLFIATADEEASGNYGARWLTEEHWDKVKCDYMISELGGFFLPGTKKPRISLTIGEKGVAWAKILCKGKAAHGSMPYKANNAALKAARIIQQVQKNKIPLCLSHEYRLMTNKLGKSPLQRWLLQSPVFFDLVLPLLYPDSVGMQKFLHSASRTTLSPNVLQAGSKVNTIPDSSSIELDIRFSEDFTEARLSDYLYSLVDASLIDDLQIHEFFPRNSSRLDTPLAAATKEIVQSHYPEAELVPFFISSVTDGRFWRQKGTTVYGFSLFAPEMTLSAYSERLHGANEHISLDSLEKSLNYFKRLPQIFFKQALKNSL